MMIELFSFGISPTLSHIVEKIRQILRNKQVEKINETKR